MNTTSRRSAFTLVEMLVVLGVIATVAAIFVPIILNMSDRDQVPKAASMVENAFSLAKSRAIAEKRPNGVRLILNNSRTTSTGQGFAWYDQLQYIESPSDYVEHWVWGIAEGGAVDVVQPWWSLRRGPTGPAAPSPGSLPWGFDAITVTATSFTYPAYTTSNSTTTVTAARARNFLLFSPLTTGDWKGNGPFPIPYVNPLTGLPDSVLASDAYRSQRLSFSFAGTTPFPVQVGDKVEILGTGELYTVVSVSTGTVTISATNAAQVAVLELDRALTNSVKPSLNGRPNYRIIRQPRVIPSLASVKLPQDVVVDFTPSLLAGAKDSTGTIYMSGVGSGNSILNGGTGSGVQTSQISGLTTATAGFAAPDYIDIMFAPSGEIMPTAQQFRNGAVIGQFNVGSSGLIALWLHSRGDPNLWAQRQITAAQGNADNQAIVAINGRTGFIGSYPINRSTADPLANARIGKARISADTGQ